MDRKIDKKAHIAEESVIVGDVTIGEDSTVLYLSLIHIQADQYKTEESIKDLSFAAEAGSAGEKILKEMECEVTSVTTQADALMEVAAGTSDACVIDLLMAGAMIGEGTSYEDLTYTVALNEEDYGVGFRQGSDLVDALNQFFKDAYADGTMMEIAEKYGVQESVVEQK